VKRSNNVEVRRFGPVKGWHSIRPNAGFLANTVRLPACPAGDIVANSEKDGLNCRYVIACEFATTIRNEMTKWGKLIRESGIRGE